MPIGPLILTLVVLGLIYGLVTAIATVLGTRVQLERERHDLLRRVAEFRLDYAERTRRQHEEARLRNAAIVAGFAGDEVGVDIVEDEPSAAAA